MQPIRIVLANDHPLVRSSLRQLLEREQGFRVIAEAANAREAVLLADYRCPDIVVLDIQLPDVNGITAARVMTGKNASTGILFVTALADEEYIREAFKAGARGYVLSDSAQTDLIPAVRAVAEGRTFVSPAVEHKAC
jgi:two-component system, NarL family, response regulator NreC